MQARQSITRRQFLARSVAISGMGTLAALVGCARPTPVPAPKPTGASAGPTPATSAGTVQLTVVVHNCCKRATFAVEKLVPRLKQDWPELKQLDVSEVQADDMEKQLLVHLAAGTGPDIFEVGSWNLGTYRAGGWLAPVDPAGFGKGKGEDVADLFYSGALVNMWDASKGNLYAIPYEWGCFGIYYNMAAYKEAGIPVDKPPKDWIEFTDVAIKTAKRDAQGNLLRVGLNAYVDTEWAWYNWHPLLMQLGGSVLSPDGKQCLLDSDLALEAAQFFTDWIVKHKVYSPGFTIPKGESDFDFAKGYISQRTHGSFVPSTFTSNFPDCVYGECWGYANFPQWPEGKNKLKLSPVWQWNLAINHKSPKIAAASRLLYEWVVKDWRAWNEVTGFVAGVKGIEKEAPSLKGPWQEKMSKDFEVARACYPNTPKFREVSQQVVEMLERMYTGQQAVKASLLEAKKKIEAILAQA